jgi:hypothetical protein
MSCRIHFKVIGGNQQVIDRTFPGILSGRMSQEEWTAFCNRIDVGMEPIGAIIKSLRREVCILIATWLVLAGILLQVSIEAMAIL